MTIDVLPTELEPSDSCANEGPTPMRVEIGDVRAMTQRNIIVIGSGIIGLTSALSLQQDGHRVQIWSKDIPLNSVSALSHVWRPSGGTRDAPSYQMLMKQIRAGVPGVELTPAIVFQNDANANTSLYQGPCDVLGDEEKRECEKRLGIKIPSSAQSVFGTAIPTFVMKKYLPWLQCEFLASGGTMRIRDVGNLSEPLSSTDIVVNCSGVGARKLAHDSSVEGRRGQAVVVSDPQSIRLAVLDDDNPQGTTHVVPREYEVVVGTSFENETCADLDPMVAQALFRRCRKLVPSLSSTTKLRDEVGLYPHRSGGIRLEVETTSLSMRNDDGTKVVIHNYGHGTSGATQAWGCAAEVINKVRELG